MSPHGPQATPPPPLGVAEFDPAGALAEAHARAFGPSRGELLATAAVAGLGALALLATGGGALGAGAGLSRQDADILNYALGLEYLQSAFYTEAERRGALRGKAAQAAAQIGAVERAHVAAFRKVLGRAATRPAFYDFRGVTEDQDAFLRTAVAFEDLAVAAYKGQAALIQSPAVLEAALAIHSVEARHAAWIRYLYGVQPAERPFDEASSRPAVERLVASTGFVVRQPRTRAATASPFTG
jgi:rubrerythrin